MTAQQVQWLATRELTDKANPQAVLKAQIGAPEGLGDNQWRCALRVEGLDSSQVHYAHGVDAFQAMMNALESIARLIRESQRELTWSGGDPGDSGFRRNVPTHLGPEFAASIESLIEREVEAKTAQLAIRTQEKLRALGHSAE